MEGEIGPRNFQGLSRAHWPLLLILAAVQFTHSMDFMIMLPLGEHCTQELGITPQQFSWLLATYGYSAAVSGLLSAFFIDRLGRKAALLMLYGGLTISTLLCAAAPDYTWLLLARSLAGVFGGIVQAFVLVIIGDTFPENQRGRATGVVMTAFSVASVAGLPVGIILGNKFGVRMPFAALGVFGMAVCVLGYRVLPPLRGHLGHGHSTALETWAVLVRPAYLRAYVFMVMLVMGTFTISPHFSIFIIRNIGRPDNDLAYIYLFGGLFTFVTVPLVGRLADRFGKRNVFQIMALCTMGTVLIMTNLSAASALPAVLCVTVLWWVFTTGRWVPAMAMITSATLPRYRGSFMSVNAAVQQMAMALAANVAGMVVGETETKELAGYAIAGLIAAISTAISIMLGRQLRPADDTAEENLLPAESDMDRTGTEMIAREDDLVLDRR